MDPISLLQKMVMIDSVNGQISHRAHAEEALVVLLEATAAQMGLQSRRLPLANGDCNLLVSVEVERNARWLIFDSHLDTVGVEGMTIDPFGGEVRDGKLWGRGACDTKSTGAAMLCALADYLHTDAKPNNVAVLFTSDEECSKAGVNAFVDDQLAQLNIKPIGVVVGEATQMQLTAAHNGVARWTINVSGKAAHSSDPSKGVSAITGMLMVVQQIESQYIPNLDASHPLTGKAQASINVIQGGMQVNVIPEQSEIQMDRRIVPGESVEQVDEHMHAYIANLREQLNVDVTINSSLLDPCMDPAVSETFCNDIATAMQAMNLSSTQIGVGYGTNGSTYTNANIPAVVLGPGDIRQAHTKDEWIEVDQLPRAQALYLALMQHPFSGATNE